MFDVAAVDKLGYDGRLEVCLVLEEDGTEIDDEEYFQVASSSTDDCSALYCAVTGRQHPADAAAAAGHLVPGGAALHVSSNTQPHLLAVETDSPPFPYCCSGSAIYYPPACCRPRVRFTTLHLVRRTAVYLSPAGWEQHQTTKVV